MGLDIIILGLIYSYPHHAYWIIFISLILAGFNLPISEDLMLITSGVLASAITPEYAKELWAAVFLGAYISDWVAYWTGRLLGPKLLTMKWTAKILKPERLNKMHAFYEKWGFFAFLVGRFVPFGVRNCLFISAGMGKMSFKKFLLIDGFASLISTSTAFYVSYTFGKHYGILLDYLKTFDLTSVLLIALLVVSLIGLFWYKRAKKVKLQRRLKETVSHKTIP